MRGDEGHQQHQHEKHQEKEHQQQQQCFPPAATADAVYFFLSVTILFDLPEICHQLDTVHGFTE